jgi:hypothetical protein
MSTLPRPAPIEWVFFKPHPALAPGAHTITIQFGPRGVVRFGCATDSPHVLAERLAWLVELFAAYPQLRENACGLVGAGDDLFDATVFEDW